MSSTHYSCQILKKLEFSSHSLKKDSTIKFHENPSSGNQVVPCGWIYGMKLKVTFFNSMKAQKKKQIKQEQ
jgi:hypothetical protein